MKIVNSLEYFTGEDKSAGDTEVTEEVASGVGLVGGVGSQLAI